MFSSPFFRIIPSSHSIMMEMQRWCRCGFVAVSRRGELSRLRDASDVHLWWTRIFDPKPWTLRRQGKIRPYAPYKWLYVNGQKSLDVQYFLAVILDSATLVHCVKSLHPLNWGSVPAASYVSTQQLRPFSGVYRNALSSTDWGMEINVPDLKNLFTTNLKA